ncbi:MAG: hypothetical protein COB20_00460 [SAR86 cluster bacterium]|uniref:SbsA Ig-like domain-containing protein n=1 Tax=SAR86 cluster bacterium TaxID=2030880 RepID=A0A2A4XIK1_9GAMM|nr:MAG: hypothetical protein COB20_00460 [SAR86 cluster bacterium]
MLKRAIINALALLVALASTPVFAQLVCDGQRVFSGGASSDSGISYSAEVSSAATISIGGLLCPQSEHLGQSADIYVAFEIAGVIYFLNDVGQLLELNTNELSAYRQQVTLASSMLQSIFSGVVGSAVESVNLYVGYTLGDVFHYDQQPINFSVRVPEKLSALSVFPAQDDTTADAAGEIRISFDRPLDPAQVSNDKIKVFGRWSGVLDGEVSLQDNNSTLRFLPVRSLSAGEWVTVSLVGGSIAALDGGVLDGGYNWSFWIESAAAGLSFEQISAISVREEGSTEQVQAYGAYAGDLNEDGWSDFIVPNEITNDLRIFLNDGAGNYGAFSIVPIILGDRPSPNEGADIDGDGDIDFIVGSANGSYVHVFKGDGLGGLLQTQNLVAGERVRGICLADFENDGDPDIIATSFGANRVALFTNDGSGNFGLLPETLDAGDGEWSCATGDMNADGLMDVTIGTRTSNELTVLLSNGDGSFTESDRVAANGDPWMLAAGDIDRDGDVDIAAVNANSKSLTVFMGSGSGSLTSMVSYSLAENDEGFPIAVDLGDLDGDGDLDIVTSDVRTKLFLIHENQGDGSFLRLPNQLFALEAASCAILHDRDNDGDLDITGIDEVVDQLLLYRH